MAQLRVWMKTTRFQDVIYLDDSELENLTDDEREAFLEEIARDALDSMYEWDYELVEEDE